MIKKLAKFLLILLFLGFGLFKTNNFLFKIKDVRQSIKKEPADKSYIADELDYLKTFYLLKKGSGYYQARYEAQKNIAGKEEERVWTKDIWGWRLPFVFYFWKLFAKNGLGIFNLFIILSACFFLSSYLIVKKFVKNNFALLSTVILLPYFLNAIKSTSFLFIAWWGMFFFAFGLMFFYYNHLFLSSFFFILAVISREHFIIPLASMFVLSVIFKKSKLVFLIPIIAFFLMILLHVHNVSSFVPLKTPLGISQRFTFLNKKKYHARRPCFFYQLIFHGRFSAFTHLDDLFNSGLKLFPL